MIRNAVIESAVIECGDKSHGVLSSWIYVDYGGSGQGFGGWSLYLPGNSSHRNLMSSAGHWIYRCMEIAGVDSWDEMPGKTIRVALKNDLIVGIGHIFKDNWFYPKNEFGRE